MGNTSSKGPFSIAMLDYRSVTAFLAASDPRKIFWLGFFLDFLPPPDFTQTRKVQLMVPTRNPALAPVEGTVVYPIILRGFFLHPRWLALGSLPSTLLLKKKDISPKTPAKVRSNMLHVPFRPVMGNFSDISGVCQHGLLDVKKSSSDIVRTTHSPNPKRNKHRKTKNPDLLKVVGQKYKIFSKWWWNMVIYHGRK